MRRLLSLAAVALLVACGDAMSPQLQPPAGTYDLSDAVHGLDGNPGFWWLPPMVPKAALSGTFQGRFQPTVVVVCQENTAKAENCDGDPLDSQVASFGIGTGLLVNTDHYQADLKTQDLGLAVTTTTDTTTYRILAFTDPLSAFGGPFVLGYADFQLADNGKQAKNLANPDSLIGLVDNQTLPIKFYINEDAYPHELQTESSPPSGEQETVCQINCSVTVVSSTETTEASLENSENPGGEIVAMLFESGTLLDDKILVLDERREQDGVEGPANCAPGINLHKLNCIRGELFNADGTRFVGTFEKDVRFGLARCNVPLGIGTHYVIKKYDVVNGEPVLVEPTQDQDVSDFFQDNCDATTIGFIGGVSRLARAVADFFVPPAFAGDSLTAGGTIRSLSDLFWALDAHTVAITSDGTVDAGTTLPMTVLVENHHQDPHEPLPDQEVVYQVLDGGGVISHAGGAPADSLSVFTDATGQATVDWAVAAGTNVLEASTPTALGGPISFTVTGLGLISHWTGDVTTEDAVGENDATWEAGATPTYAPGIIDNAFSFTGDARIVRAQDGDGDWGTSSSFTVAAWVYMDPAGSPTALQRLVTVTGGNGLRSYLYQDAAASGEERALALVMDFPTLSPASRVLRVPNALANACWQHVAATYDGTSMRLFIDGGLVADATVSAPLATATNLWLSHDFVDASGAPTASLNGRIDDLRVYNKALAATEIQDLPGMNTAPSCEPDLAFASSPAIAPTTLPAGNAVTIGDWSVINQGGDIPAGLDVDAGVYLSTDAAITTDDTPLGVYTITDAVSGTGMASGEVISRVATDWVIPAGTAPGSYHIGLLLDDGGTVSESDETNNTFAVPLTICDPSAVSLDGSICGDEWAAANTFEFDVNTPENGTTPATLYVLNDDVNLYLAVRFQRDVVDPGNTLSFEFDSDASGTLNHGDDGILLNPSIGFRDLVRQDCIIDDQPSLCGVFDTEVGGTSDGAAAFGNDGQFTAYEFVHPLDSGDAFDFARAPGSQLGLRIFVRMIAQGAVFPDGFGDTRFPTTGFHQITLQGDSQ